jgi:hypothetical protein
MILEMHLIKSGIQRLTLSPSSSPPSGHQSKWAFPGPIPMKTHRLLIETAAAIN